MATYELTQSFFFEASHTLDREIDTESSRRIHGHTYSAEVTLVGAPDPSSGMVVDLGRFRMAIEVVKNLLDHRMLDDVPGLGKPTMEGLCAFIAGALLREFENVSSVRVWRAMSGDACKLTL